MSVNSVDRSVRRWPTPRARQWTLDFLRRARDNPDVVAVIAIGSAVRDNVPSDDLDMLVLCRAKETLCERAPIEVDLRAYDVDDVDRQVAGGRDLLTWAILFGRPLFDRFQTWENIVARWRMRVPLPDARVARSRAAATLARLVSYPSSAPHNSRHGPLVDFCPDGREALCPRLRDGIAVRCGPPLVDWPAARAGRFMSRLSRTAH